MSGCDLRILSNASVACFCCPLFIEPCVRLMRSPQQSPVAPKPQALAHKSMSYPKLS
jgi:hypothetical protein